MNSETAKKLKENAKGIDQFRSLHPSEQEWLLPMMSPTFRKALELLDCISNQSKTYDEIANELELHINTVKQIIYALIEGGAAIDADHFCAYARTGRPRKLSRR